MKSVKTDRTEDFAPSEADFLEANLDGVYDDTSDIFGDNKSVHDGKMNDENVALYIESTRGKPCLLLNGYKYRKAYKSKFGTRWNCSKFKNCLAHLYLSDKDEITKCHEVHDHPMDDKLDIVDETTDGTAAVVITSRKGKELLLYRQYTYRKQYMGTNRVRWVCSTEKSCKAFVSTNPDNFIISSCEDHCHDPPKYYLKPDHVMNALAQPVIFETD